MLAISNCCFVNIVAVCVTRIAMRCLSLRRVLGVALRAIGTVYRVLGIALRAIGAVYRVLDVALRAIGTV